MFGMGYTEMMVVGVVALLLFGSRLPEVARSLGKGMREFKEGMSGVTDEFHSAYSAGSTTSSSTQNISHRPAPSSDDETDELAAPKFDPPPPPTASEPVHQETTL